MITIAYLCESQDFIITDIVGITYLDNRTEQDIKDTILNEYPDAIFKVDANRIKWYSLTYWENHMKDKHTGRITRRIREDRGK